MKPTNAKKRPQTTDKKPRHGVKFDETTPKKEEEENIINVTPVKKNLTASMLGNSGAKTADKSDAQGFSPSPNNRLGFSGTKSFS